VVEQSQQNPPPVPRGLPVFLFGLARQKKAPSDRVLDGFVRATRPPVTTSNNCTVLNVAQLKQDPLGVPQADQRTTRLRRGTADSLLKPATDVRSTFEWCSTASPFLRRSRSASLREAHHVGGEPGQDHRSACLPAHSPTASWPTTPTL
jgi:hypothetical protein